MTKLSKCVEINYNQTHIFICLGTSLLEKNTKIENEEIKIDLKN